MSSDRVKNNSIKPAQAERVVFWNLPSIFHRATPALLLLLSITLIIFHSTNSKVVERIRASTIDVISPFLSITSAPVTSVINSIDDVSAFQDIKADNIRLKSENEKLKKWYEAALKLQAENRSFRDLLNVKVDRTLSFVTSRIISDAGSSFVKSVLLPVGTNDKVRKDSAVMSGQSLIGRITEVGATSSRVLLVTDLNSRIPVIIQNTRTRAILAGKNTDLLRLERLPQDSGITIGTRVVTSGDDAQLPAEIPIGTIVAVNAEGVWVRPLSDISKLTYVQVVNSDIDQTLVTGEIGQ